MSERWLVVLGRNVGLALLLGAGLFALLPRWGAWVWDAFDAFVLGLAFALVGWASERVLLALPGIDTLPGRLVRLAGWFAGGLWAYLLGREVWRLFGRDILELPALVWGGVFLVALELVLHVGLAALGRRSIFTAAGP
jgi:hypothetical protein